MVCLHSLARERPGGEPEVTSLHFYMNYILQPTFPFPSCVSNFAWSSCKQINRGKNSSSASIIYLSLTCPINARYWLSVSLFFSFLFLSLYMRPLYNIGTLLEKDRRCQRGTVLIYNLATAKPTGEGAWHIIKNGCIVGGTRFCQLSYFGEWQAIKNTSLSRTQEYLK